MNEAARKSVEEIRNHLYSTEVNTMLAVINRLLSVVDSQEEEIKGLNFSEVDGKRLEEIRQWWNKPDVWPPDSIGDVKWLLVQIDVLTFKVSNVTTERDVANQEIERLKDARVLIREEHRPQFTAAKEMIEWLQIKCQWYEIESIAASGWLTTANAKVGKLEKELKQWKECYMEKTAPPDTEEK